MFIYHMSNNIIQSKDGLNETFRKFNKPNCFDYLMRKDTKLCNTF